MINLFHSDAFRPGISSTRTLLIKMRDRTKELQSKNFESTATVMDDKDIELGIISHSSFLDAASEIKLKCTRMEETLSKLHRAQSAVLTSITDSEKTRTQSQIDKYVNDCSGLSSQIRRDLKDMERIVNASKFGSADYRMFNAQHIALTSKFRDIIIQYQSQQKQYRDRQPNQCNAELFSVP